MSVTSLTYISVSILIISNLDTCLQISHITIRESTYSPDVIVSERTNLNIINKRLI